MSVIMLFLQDCLDNGGTPSTLKGVCGSHFIDCRPLIVSQQVITVWWHGFWEEWDGCYLTWYLPGFVFGASALSEPPFEPLHAMELNVLSFKTCSVYWHGLYGLTPRCGYVPKVLSTPFRAQVIKLKRLLLGRPCLSHILYALFLLCMRTWTGLVILDCQSSCLSVSEVAVKVCYFRKSACLIGLWKL